LSHVNAAGNKENAMQRITIVALSAMLTLVGAAVGRAESAQEIGTEVLTQYQEIQAALAADTTDGVRGAAARIVETVKPCECTQGETEAAQAVVDAATAMDGADLATLREQLKALSKALPAYLEVTGVDSAQIYFCPMVKAYWLQGKGDGATHNPYYGKAMPGCGVKVERVAG